MQKYFQFLFVACDIDLGYILVHFLRNIPLMHHKTDQMETAVIFWQMADINIISHSAHHTFVEPHCVLYFVEAAFDLTQI